MYLTDRQDVKAFGFVPACVLPRQSQRLGPGCGRPVIGWERNGVKEHPVYASRDDKYSPPRLWHGHPACAKWAPSQPGACRLFNGSGRPRAAGGKGFRYSEAGHLRYQLRLAPGRRRLVRVSVIAVAWPTWILNPLDSVRRQVAMSCKSKIVPPRGVPAQHIQPS